jgi:hypothetical protein
LPIVAHLRHPRFERLTTTMWGAYKKVSPAYLQSYLNEYAWRYNVRRNDGALSRNWSPAQPVVELGGGPGDRPDRQQHEQETAPVDRSGAHRRRPAGYVRSARHNAHDPGASLTCDRRRLRAEQEFAVPHTGQQAATSGIYANDCHAKQIALSKGETFPPCSHFRRAAHWRLIRATR